MNGRDLRDMRSPTLWQPQPPLRYVGNLPITRRYLGISQRRARSRRPDRLRGRITEEPRLEPPSSPCASKRQTGVRGFVPPPLRPGRLTAFALAIAFTRVFAVPARRPRRAAPSNDDRDGVDIDLEQIEVARHLAQFLTLAGDLLRDIDRHVALGD